MFSLCLVNASCGESITQDNNIPQSTKSLTAEPKAEDSFTKTVTLRASDSRVVFQDISSSWRDFNAKGIGTHEITYEVLSDDHGYECEIEHMRVFTSNKAIIVPSGNICENSILEIDINWPEYDKAAITLKGMGFQWGLHHRPPTEAFPFIVDVLTYGMPETDNTAITFECTRDSQFVQMSVFSALIIGVKPQDDPIVNFISNDSNDPILYRFASKWEHAEIGDGLHRFPAIYDHIDHPFFSEFEKDQGFDLFVKNASKQVLRIDTKTDEGVLRKFAKLCRGNA